jgi:hypothetical protein
MIAATHRMFQVVIHQPAATRVCKYKIFYSILIDIEELKASK